MLGVLESDDDDEGEVLEICELNDGLTGLDNIEANEAEGDPTFDEDIIDAVEIDGPTNAVLLVLCAEVE